MGNLETSDSTKARYRMMKQRNCKVESYCTCYCSKRMGGFCVPNAKDRRSSDIFLCEKDRWKSQSYYAEVFLHEFSHAFDRCMGGDPAEPCEKDLGVFVCGELRAYYFNDPQKGWYPGKKESVISRACDSVEAACPKTEGLRDRCLRRAAEIYDTCTQLEPTDPLPPIPPETPQVLVALPQGGRP